MKRKARKEHICDTCGEVIQKGEVYEYDELRVPRLDEQDVQVGIEYFKFKTCWHCFALCHEKQEEHYFVDEYVTDGFVSGNRVMSPTGRQYCVKCGMYKEDYDNIHH